LYSLRSSILSSNDLVTYSFDIQLKPRASKAAMRR
jgi:hypothetical protein